MKAFPSSTCVNNKSCQDTLLGDSEVPKITIYRVGFAIDFRLTTKTLPKRTYTPFQSRNIFAFSFCVFVELIIGKKSSLLISDKLHSNAIMSTLQNKKNHHFFASKLDFLLTYLFIGIFVA